MAAKVLTAHFGRPGLAPLATVHEREAATQALRKALAMKPDEVIEEVKDSPACAAAAAPASRPA